MSLVSEPIKAFLAYPSRPAAVGDALEAFRREVNRASEVSITSWTEMSGGGRLLIDAITRTIARSNLVIADLTGLNLNVMFEIGYAIALDKRLWFTLNAERANAAEAMDRFLPLSGYGQVRYRNSTDLMSAFYKERPSDSLSCTILQESIIPRIGKPLESHLLYLKLPHNDESAVRIQRRLDKEIIPVRTDFPGESPLMSLEAAAPRIFTAVAVLAHLPGCDHVNQHAQAAQHSLFAGLAHGLDKPLLMLRESGPPPPLDYRSLLIEYQNSNHAASIVNEWIRPLEAQWVSNVKRRAANKLQHERIQWLNSFLPAEYIAENETDVLDEYFVETAPYHAALKGQTALYVGRKGTGKTANLLRIKHELARSGDALPVVLKIPAYEMQALVQKLTSTRSADTRTYTLESLWKTLIFAEIAKAIEHHGITEHPSTGINTARITSLLDSNNGMLREDPAIRIEKLSTLLLERIDRDEGTSSGEAFRQGVSEILHTSLIHELRSAIAEAWSGRQRIAVLIDNLDKVWDKAQDLDGVSQSLLALIAVPGRIVQEFERTSSLKRPIQVSLALYIRSDIYQRLLSCAQEPDKISTYELRWDDQNTLLRVLERRMIYFGREKFTSAGQAWLELMPRNVRGMPVQKWITSQIVQRPRDLIYLFNASIICAINRGHSKIEENDLIDGATDYSRFATMALQVENGIPAATLQQVLAEFLDSPAIMTRAEAIERIQRTSQDGLTILNHLMRLGFLGIEVSEGQFEWALDPSDFAENEQRARKRFPNGNSRCSVAVPYRRFLEVQE